MNCARWSAIAVVLAASSIGSKVAADAPTRCDVAERSANGGVVEVYTDETPAPAWFPLGNKPQILWRPPPAPPSAQLVLGYPNATLMEIGNDPSGGHIRFRISPPTANDDTLVIVSLPNRESYTLRGHDLLYGRDFGSDDESRPVMDVAFGRDTESWTKIRSAIVEGRTLKVELVRHGQTLATVEFDFSNRAARDVLLAQARHKVASSDPHVCTNTPRPVVRMN